MAVSTGHGHAREVESVGLMTEGTAGIAVVVLAVLGLAEVSPAMFAAIVTVLIGAGLMVEGFTMAAEESPSGATAFAEMSAEISGRSLILLMIGLTGLILGILGIVGVNATHLIPAALIVFGAGLLLNGASSAFGPRQPAGEAGQAPYRNSSALWGFGAMVGIAAIVLGILALILKQSWVLPLVGFIAVGAALLLTSATFGAGMLRFITERGGAAAE